MFRTCQNCHRSMSPHEGGWICTSCGHIEAKDSPKDPQPAHSSSQSSFDPIPTPNSPLSVEELPSKPNTPHVISHRASSYYRQHLSERLSQLSTPELPAPDESPALAERYTPTLETTHGSTERMLIPLPTPERIEAPELPVESTPPDISSAHEPQEHRTEPERPFRPSAYVVHATSPIERHNASERPLPPALSRTSNSEAELLNQARKASQKSTVQPTPTSNHGEATFGTRSPHALADELLASAASPSREKPQTHYTWVLASASLLVLIAGGIGAWLLLKQPSNPSSSPQSTPTVQSSTSLLTTTKEPTKRDTQRKNDLNSIAIGLEAYHKSTGAYPVGNDISILSSLEKTTPPFITHINLDPSSTPGSDIKYSYSADGSSFTLSAILENPLDADAKDGLYIVRNK